MSVLTALLIFNHRLYAQEKYTVQEEPKIKLELVWEKEYEAPILDFIYSEGKNGPALQVVITTDKVQFFSMKETKEIITKDIQLNRKERWFYGVSCSRNGKYIGISKLNYGEYGYIQKGSEFQVYDNAGNLLATREATENSHPGTLLNNGAFLVTGVLEDARIFLEQLNGSRKLIFNGNDMGPSTYIDISKNSDFFALNISGIGVILYSDKGEKFWQKKFDWGDAANVKISDNGKYIIAVGILSGGGVYLLSSDGDLLWKYPPNNYYNFYLNCIDFSPDEKYFAANVTRDNIYLFESSTGKILWNCKLEKKDESRKFFSIAVSKDAKFVSAADGGGTREFPAGDSSTVFLFDKEGHIVWRRDIMIQKEQAPSIRFSDEGNYLFISISNTLYCYKIVGGVQ
jgi:outer membrane protein assembly factor BamB